jgi:hypothetical protein
MSPVAEIKRWAHQAHMPYIHIWHLHPVLWVEKHLTTRNFIIMAAVAAVVAIYILLAIWAYLYGSGPADKAIESFYYYWP